MKRINLILSIVLFFNQVAFANNLIEQRNKQCGEEYIKYFEENVVNNIDRIGSLYSYEQKLRFFNGDHVEASLTQGVVIASSVFLVPLMFSFDLYRNRENGQFDFVGKAIIDPNSFEAETGIDIMYEAVSEEVQINMSEFKDFFVNEFPRYELCKYDQRVVFTERGSQLVGTSMLTFMHEAHGTPLWDQFWKDERNFKVKYFYRPMFMEEVQSKLTLALLKNGFQRLN